MNIEGLDYNTQREALLMPEYGREIQKMVDYAVGLPTKSERYDAAVTIIKMMSTKVEQQRSGEEHLQMLWDHLYLMSHKQLDIDWPYDTSEAEKFLDRPQPLPHPKADDRMRMRHYGRLLEQTLDKLATMEEGEERDALTSITAHQMRRVLLTYGHGTQENERIADDIAHYTNGRVKLNLETFKFNKTAVLDPTDSQRKKGRK